MMSPKYGYILIVVSLIQSVAAQDLVHLPDAQTENSEETTTVKVNQNHDAFVMPQAEEFIPTKEWQVIKEGQSIPKGLHIRMNFQTGIKAAKLLDESETDSQPKEEVEEGAHRRISIALEEALKNIATSHDEPSGNKEKGVVDEKREFRSIEEIQAAFAEKNITISSEMELLTGLYKELTNPETDSATKVSVLDDIEYHVHKYDNAVYFADLGGIARLTELLNSSSDADVLSGVAITLGSAAQSNENVALQARTASTASVIVRRLNDQKQSGLFSRYIFCLSSLTRALPEVLQDFNKLGGQQILRAIIAEKDNQVKAKVKIYTLITDLLTDYRFNAVDVLNEDSSQVLCDELPPLLLKHGNEADVLEKLLNFVQVTREKYTACEASMTSVNPIISNLYETYRGDLESPDESEAEYSLLIVDIIDHFKTSENQRVTSDGNQRIEL